MKKVTQLVVVCFMLMGLYGCSSGNLDHVKEHGPEKWNEIGFQVVGYEGFEWGFWGLNHYGGAEVWWRLKRIPDNGISYTGYIQRWGNELHVFGPTATDAIRP